MLTRIAPEGSHQQALQAGRVRREIRDAGRGEVGRGEEKGKAEWRGGEMDEYTGNRVKGGRGETV